MPEVDRDEEESDVAKHEELIPTCVKVLHLEDEQVSKYDTHHVDMITSRPEAKCLSVWHQSIRGKNEAMRVSLNPYEAITPIDHALANGESSWSILHDINAGLPIT